jgi:hypothetical protein
MSDAEWKEGDMPKDGTPIVMQVENVFRYLPYKPSSQQAKRGDKGRWQEMNEFGGWDNCSHPFGNKWRLAAMPSKTENEWTDA